MYDEMRVGGSFRAQYARIAQWLDSTDPRTLLTRSSEAEALFREAGITFAVYGEGGDPERLIPIDIIPRVFTASEWDVVERGSLQRAEALNAFLADIYGDQNCLAEGIVPKALVEGNPAYLPQLCGAKPALDVWAHIIGVDIVREGADKFYVLEDNCRTPSGVSYLLESREASLRLLPELFDGGQVRPVDDYTAMLGAAMEACAPPGCQGTPTAALLTPGLYNSAFYEHSFLASGLGIELVEGKDLFVDGDDVLYMRTTAGPQRVDVLYRRIDDDFLDPERFNPKSMLGVPGLMRAWEAGNLTLMNAPGTGVADDKAMYRYLPALIRYYLDEEPILHNVPTLECADPDSLKEVLANLDQMVVKLVDGSGGYGMLIGPKASDAEIAAFREKLIANPAHYVAQPTLSLSTVPSLQADGTVGARHVDLRPYVITSDKPRLIHGGLTRVALKEGSLVVNSSQGGGVKDTIVLVGDRFDDA